MTEQKAQVAPWDAPWTFTVTWDSESDILPNPILRLFHYRSTIKPGRAVLRTDKGHATYYVQAVQKYVARYHPERLDIMATADEVVPCEHDTLGCGWRVEHEPHTKTGDGRPCCGWPPRCDVADAQPSGE